MALTGSKTAWKVLGMGSGEGGGLQKLEIRYETKADKVGNITDWEAFKVLFNPNQLKFARTVKWDVEEVAIKSGKARARKLKFVTARPETLALTLFFDTLDADLRNDIQKVMVPTNPFGAPRAADVRQETLRFVELAQIGQHLHQPPRCVLFWGGKRFFRGVVTDLKQKLTMFLPDGTPVRATIDCTFTQTDTTREPVLRNELQSADVAKTVVVRVADSLPAIAAAEYNDPGMWRVIARANGITNPRIVAPGTVLILPPLQP